MIATRSRGDIVTPTDDPFRHHPELRGKIVAAETSFYRSFTTGMLEQMMRKHGLPTGWWYPEEVLQAAHRAFLQRLGPHDLWVFAYGSLMWDPAVQFAEVRVGHLPGYARSFCLFDVLGGRGRPEAPGLFAALDRGEGCKGLLFRIPAAQVAAETAILWQREMVAPAYAAEVVEVATAQGTVEALAFLADHSAEAICPHLSRADRVRYLATGEGVLGTSLAYIETLVAQLAVLGLEDAEVSALLADAKAYRAAEAATPRA